VGRRPEEVLLDARSLLRRAGTAAGADQADEAGASGYLHKSALTSPDLADALLVLHTNYESRVPDPD